MEPNRKLLGLNLTVRQFAQNLNHADRVGGGLDLGARCGAGRLRQTDDETDGRAPEKEQEEYEGEVLQATSPTVAWKIALLKSVGIKNTVPVIRVVSR